MNQWQEKSLGELVRFVGGGTPSRDEPGYWGGPIPWASVKDLQAIEIDKTQETITQEGLRSSAANLFPSGTVIIASRVGLGKVAITRRAVAINQDLKALLPLADNLLPRFLLYFFMTIGDQIERAGNGTTVKGVTVEYLQQLKIPFPSISDQTRVIAILDEALALQELRSRADSLFPTLTVSLFDDLFGSPATNPKGWPVTLLGNVFDNARTGVKCGPFGSALKKDEYVESGIPVWGIPNVLPNAFVEENSLFISPAKFRHLQAYAVESGDLLISRAGTVGRICVARPRHKDSIIGTNLIRLRLQQDKLLPEVFASLLTYFVSGATSLRADTDTTAYSFMNTTALKTLPVYLPPIRLQTKFVELAAELHEFENAAIASRKTLKELMRSLLQRGFKGDL